MLQFGTQIDDPIQLTFDPSDREVDLSLSQRGESADNGWDEGMYGLADSGTAHTRGSHGHG
jgi:hypothetical protein